MEFDLASARDRERDVLIVACDHAPLGLLPGPRGLTDTVRALLPHRPDGVVLNYGPLRRLAPAMRNTGVVPIARLDGNRTYLHGDWTRSDEWELFFTADQAARAGAGAAIVNLLIGGPAELASLRVVARAAAECAEIGIPLYVSAIAVDSHEGDPVERTAFAARMADELGADVVNAYGMTDPATVQDVREWCDTPVIAQGAPAGGGPADVVNWAEKCVNAGASGVCVGRAIWDSSDPAEVVSLLRSAVSPAPVTTAPTRR